MIILNNKNISMGNVYSDYDFITIKHNEYNHSILMHLSTGYYNISNLNYDTNKINKWFKSNAAKKIIKSLEKDLDGKKVYFKIGRKASKKYRGIYVSNKIFKYLLFAIDSNFIYKSKDLNTIHE